MNNFLKFLCCDVFHISTKQTEIKIGTMLQGIAVKAPTMLFLVMVVEVFANLR